MTVCSALVKGVILAGGTGTRLHPLTRITNKHLLPIYDRPMISYSIEALVRAGIDEVMLVTGGTHAGEFLRLLGSGHEHGLERLRTRTRTGPAGSPRLSGWRALLRVDPVLVMLADNSSSTPSPRPSSVSSRRGQGARIILTEPDDATHLRHLGVPELDEYGRILRIVEKPEDPPSRLCSHRHLLLRP